MEERHVEERLVSFRPRAILVVLGIILAAVAIIAFLFLAWHVITWILIALFLSLALNPAVEYFERRGLRRSLASLLVFLLALFAFAGLGALLIPPLVSQIEEFADAVPGFVDLTAGRGPSVPAGRLPDRRQGSGGGRGPGRRRDPRRHQREPRGRTRSRLVRRRRRDHRVPDDLHAPGRAAHRQRFRDSLPEHMKPRLDRVGGDIYRTVGGYVGGNLAISVIAGVTSAIVLFALGSSYAIALAVVVALLDLIPLAGATIAAVIVSTVSFIELGWVRGVIVIGFFVVYQQLENHILQPVIYGRTVQLSPLTVLIAILIGAELVGILGALAAIPVAGIIQAIFREVLRWRREAILPAGMEVTLPDEPAAET